MPPFIGCSFALPGIDLKIDCPLESSLDEASLERLIGISGACLPSIKKPPKMKVPIFNYVIYQITGSENSGLPPIPSIPDSISWASSITFIA